MYLREFIRRGREPDNPVVADTGAERFRYTSWVMVDHVVGIEPVKVFPLSDNVVSAESLVSVDGSVPDCWLPLMLSSLPRNPNNATKLPRVEIDVAVRTDCAGHQNRSQREGKILVGAVAVRTRALSKSKPMPASRCSVGYRPIAMFYNAPPHNHTTTTIRR